METLARVIFRSIGYAYASGDERKQYGNDWIDAAKLRERAATDIYTKRGMQWDREADVCRKILELAKWSTLSEHWKSFPIK